MDIFKEISPTIISFERAREYHKQTKPLKCGDLLTFNGFAIHRGCSYPSLNFRMHWYAVHQKDNIHLSTVGDYTTFIDLNNFVINC